MDLLHEHAENQRLWLDAREAIRRTLFDLVPVQRLGVPGDDEAFNRGWDQCRAEIRRRIEELAKVI